MRKLYEIFKMLQVQKRIVSAETIRGNTVISCQATIRQSSESLQECKLCHLSQSLWNWKPVESCFSPFLWFLHRYWLVKPQMLPSNVITVLKLKQYFILLVLRFFISRTDHTEKRERHTYLNSKHHILLTFLRFFVRSIQIFAKIPVRKKKVAMCSARLS